MKNRPFDFLFFLFIWLCTGFTLGTLMLLWPVRWWVNFIRDQSLGSTIENIGVLFLIILLIGLSFWLSRLIFHWQLRSNHKVQKVMSAVIPFFTAFGALLLFLQPDLINDQQNTKVSEQFTIGPYPTEEKMKSLKAEGYTAIISLLHPAVLPFEPRLMSQEQELADEYGIRLIKASMLPWVSDNEASLKTIEQLARNKQERYYVHCYLGKDRVNLVKNLLFKLAGEEAVKVEKLSANRTFEEKKKFERGELFRLRAGVYFTPYPTKEEFLAFFLASEVKTVINLMDSTNLDHKKRILEEREFLKRSDIRFENSAINMEHPNLKEQAKLVIKLIEQSPKPLVVHHWNIISPEAQYFLKTFAKHTQEQSINLNQK